MIDRTQALEQLAMDVDSASWPALDDTELGVIIDRAAMVDFGGNPPTNVDTAATWESATAFTVGQVIQVDERWWRCVVAGTTAVTEPSWPNLEGEERSSFRFIDGTVACGRRGRVADQGRQGRRFARLLDGRPVVRPGPGAQALHGDGSVVREPDRRVGRHRAALIGGRHARTVRDRCDARDVRTGDA
jgi:hypothetical protein